MAGDVAKTKVAILGGGVGALAAAFDLTEQDPNRTPYDITVYQGGWRLGGKGAVGWTSGGDGDTRKPQVRLEHGLHVWGGYYDSAFDLLKRCYAAHPNPPFESFRDAFEGVDHCWVEELVGQNWTPWRLDFPRNGLTPGIGRTHS